MHSSQDMWKLVFRALIQKTHGRAWICMSFPIKISWDHRIWGRDFLCSGRRGCPVSFRVLHPSVSLLHTERVQGCAGVCRLEMKPNLQTSILGKNTVGLWLSSWFCFTSGRCWYFSSSCQPPARWAAPAMWASADQLEEALLGNNESTCEVWMDIHVILNFRWWLGDAQPPCSAGATAGDAGGTCHHPSPTPWSGLRLCELPAPLGVVAQTCVGNPAQGGWNPTRVPELENPGVNLPAHPTHPT